jgi:peptidoglycan/xylan/chitin deacetylase (PgdA/CDA1 family)
MAYEKDECVYLQRRWDPANSAPGTVLVPIMFHSVAKTGHPFPEGVDTTISVDYFDSIMEHAHALGYQTITTAQAAAFLERNAPIPPRSMILIVDDRRPGVIREQFMPYLEKYNWTVTLGYISGVNTAFDWKEMQTLAESGHLDVQSHGYLHNGSTYFVPQTPETTVWQELFAPIPVLKQYFGVRPIAFVWPGGNFTPHTVEMARLGGYQLGFSSYSRGPVLYNWVPLGAEEQAVNDPLMVLPRYWDTAGWINLDDGVQAAAQAQDFAQKNKASEMDWMKTNCAKNGN